jgi:hypothetical protein
MTSFVAVFLGSVIVGAHLAHWLGGDPYVWPGAFLGGIGGAVLIFFDIRQGRQKCEVCAASPSEEAN